MKRQIDIVRIAVQSALGASLEETVRALAAGEVGVHHAHSLEQEPSSPSGVGEIPITDTNTLGADRAERLLGQTLRALLTEADRASMRDGSQRWVMVLGTTLAGMRHCGAGLRADERGDTKAADDSYARCTAASVLARAIGDLPLQGPVLTVSAACASALAAISHGCSLLHAGDADLVIAGGYDPVSEFVYGGFSALQLVAPGALSPFAAEREGMKLGEGIALCILRRSGEAVSDAEPPLATIVATGEASDAHHLTQPHPAGAGAASAMRQVGADITAPELLLAHATGTPSNDIVEYLAYLALFGDRLKRVPTVALKSRFGHPLGAAGALELFSAIGCAEAGFIPTTAGRGCDQEAFPLLNLLEGNVRPGSPRDIVALAAGFGGANAAIRIRRGDARLATVPTQASGVPAVRHAVRIVGSGAVSPAGQGTATLARALTASGFEHPFDEQMLSPLLDAAKTRRLALLPRLMIAAVQDLCQVHRITRAELREIPLIAASWCGAADFTERYYRDLIRSGIDLANPMLFAESVPNIGSSQASIALGIEASSMSTIGSRAAGVQALLLAKARIASGEWERAIVVAAEEEHPLVTRVMRHCSGVEFPAFSAAVALLLDRDSGVGASAGAHAAEGASLAPRTISSVRGHTAPLHAVRATHLASAHLGYPLLTSDSPFDRPLAVAAGARVLRCGELGTVSAVAALAFAHLLDSRPSTVGTCDPHGACWCTELR